MKMKSALIVVSLILIAAVFPNSLFAKTISDEKATVAKNEVINDDLFISGGNVSVLGTVNGDVYAAGGNVVINGDIAGDVMILGGDVRVSGTIKNNVRAVAGNIVFDSSEIGKNISVIAGNGSKTGENKLTGRSYIFMPGEDPVTHERRPVVQTGPSFPILSFLSAFLVGALLLKYAKPVVDRVTKEIQTKQNASLLAGFLALFITPFILIFLLITIIGIPLALIAGVLFAIDIYLSKIFVGAFIGEYVNKRFTLKSDNKYLNFAVGLIVIDIAMLIPIINFFVGILVLLLGLGALVRVKRAYLFSGKK